MKLIAIAIAFFVLPINPVGAQVPGNAALSPSPVSIETPSNPPPVMVYDQQMIKLNDNLRYAGCVNFLNMSQKLITAVRFDFNMVNAFHESVSHFHGDRTGTFSPGVSIQGPQNLDDYNIGVRGGSLGGANQKIKNCWLNYINGTEPQSMEVTVTHVIFADGSEWIR